MNERDRFAEFLRREGASYHAPPETPSDAMWSRVGARLDAQAYNAPPPAPREAMWERIEAQRAAGRATARTAGPVTVGPVAEPARLPGRWRRKGSATAWTAGLAAAASLVLGLVLGRNSQGPETGPAAGPQAAPVSAPTPDRVVPATLVERPAPEPEGRDEPAPEVVAANAAAPETEVAATNAAAPETEVTPQRTAPQRTVARPAVLQRAAEEQPVAAASARTEAVLAQPRLFEPKADFVTTRHLGRAETLLTAFRIDQGTPMSEQDLARWARELLGDTRMLLDMPVSQSPVERALLEELELVLLQISRLGPEAPAFERQLALESMEWKGTLTRLRAASATGET